MKIIITPEQIEFKRKFFSIIYLKKDSPNVLLFATNPMNREMPFKKWMPIQSLEQANKTTNLSAADIVSCMEPKNRFIQYRYGFLGKLNYLFQLDIYFFSIMEEGSMVPGLKFPDMYTYISNFSFFSSNNTKSFLQNLKNNGYNVDEKIAIVDVLTKKSVTESLEKSSLKKISPKIFSISWLILISVILILYIVYLLSEKYTS